MARSRVSSSWSYSCLFPIPIPSTLFILLALLLLTAPPLLAQLGPASFSEEITVTATGEEERTEVVPVPVEVITREEMDDAQADTVADLLRRSPGVTVSSSGGDGAVTSVFTRGTESDHTLVLLDGVRLTSPYFGGYDWSLVPTAGLDRVEVARGPFSALWGSDAIGGVVNLIPARAARGLEASALGEGGEAGWRRLEGVAAWGGDRLDLYASAFSHKGSGELDNSDFALDQVLVDLGSKLGNRGRVALLVQDVDAEAGVPFTTPGVPSPERRQWTEQRLLAAPLELELSPGWRLEVVPSRVEREFRFVDPGDPWGLTGSDTAANTTEARVASHHHLGDHALTWGGEWREDEVDDESTYGVNLAGNTTQTGSLFLQDQWQAGTAVRLVGGARWDRTDEWGSRFSPRLDLGWALARGLELRAGYGQAFRQPSVGELYFPLFGNPSLEPETSRSAELGLAWWASDGSCSGQLNLFATDLDNLVEYDYASLTFANLRSAEIRGLELGVSAPVASRLVASASLTWLDTQDPDGDRLLRRPTLSAAVTVRGRIASRLRADLSLTWVGARDDVDPVSFARTRNDSYLTADLALAIGLWQNLELTVRATNLADAEYQEVLGYPAPGRRLFAGARIGG